MLKAFDCTIISMSKDLVPFLGLLSDLTRFEPNNSSFVFISHILFSVSTFPLLCLIILIPQMNS